MPPTYLSTLAAFTSFLTAYTHTLLYLRTLYPRTSFVHSRFHNTSVYQSRHPLVCEWIRDALSAVHAQLLTGSLSRIGIVIFAQHNANDDQTGSAAILERYMVDVSRFPVVEKSERETRIEWASDSRSPSPDDNIPARDDDEDVDANLSEQFRAALIALTTRTAQLAPLPPSCSFNVAMELKDEMGVDPPIAHPMPWVPVQPSLQKTGRGGVGETKKQKTGKRGEDDMEREEDDGKEGADLGGVRVTPIRSVQAGVFRFETWVEEGRAKFDIKGKA
ncbi:DNA-binding protein [Dothidotthia symphoricarpi CBS 119687]|uniref:DNA-binding protein n=1 Tax=Dothidotthia symphoricarpi CBS 119687 TaxID=1392245 RepID=A0A6A6AHG4_9PLEO|nr:DNA-binding protein [Dothidotthia symphoricarpi CBS 119687]KAF2131389.1 DNA-binding protein [Dothidotthia symphoricarpi CBS 119687]